MRKRKIKQKVFFAGGIVIVIITAVLISACPIESGYLDKIQEKLNQDLGIGNTYTVTYNANGADSGSVPSDVNRYKSGMTVTVLGNPGNLVKTEFIFSGWNTMDDGTGMTYTQADTFEIGNADVILYARWTTKPTYNVIYKGNGNTGGNVPVDTTNYEEGMTATVFGNAGNLVKEGCSFSGWNSASDGNGTGYKSGDKLVMGTKDVDLFADWMPVWINSYGSNNGTETLQSLFQTDDGGFVGVGTTNAGSGGGTDIYVFKVDEDGEYLWQYSYGESQEDETVGGGLLPNGKIVVVANTTVTGRGQEIRVLCLNPDGTIDWQKRYGEQGIDHDQYALDMDITANGDIVICGSAYNPDVSAMDYMLMKISAEGSSDWVKRKDVKSGDEAYTSLKASNDGSIYLTNSGTLIIKSSAGESIDYLYNLSHFGNYLADSINNDGLLSLSSYNSTLYISKSDYNGSEIWDFYFKGSDSQVGIDLSQYPDGTIVVAGMTTDNSSTGKDLLLVVEARSILVM